MFPLGRTPSPRSYSPPAEPPAAPRGEAKAVRPLSHWERGRGAGDPPSSTPFLELVAFRLGEQRYAIDLAAAERVLPMVAVSPLPQAPPVALGVINLRGQVIPVLDVRARFGLPARAFGLAGQLLVAHSARRRMALPVDEVLGPMSLPPEAATRADAVLPGIGQVAGMAALPDGTLFIHDLDAFLSLDEDRELGEALGEIASEPA